MSPRGGHNGGRPKPVDKPSWYGVGQNPVDRREPEPEPRTCLACGDTEGPWAAARLCTECAGHGILPSQLLGPR